jgi:hypothetical protein
LGWREDFARKSKTKPNYMTNNKRLFFGLFSVFALVTLFTLHTFGQSPPLPAGIDPVAATNGAPANTPAITEQATVTSLVMGFIPVLVPLLIAGKKKIMELLSLPKFPAWILPMLAVGLGELLNWIASLSGHGTGPLLAGLLGAAGIGVREILDQVKGRITNGAAMSLIVGGLLIGFVATGCFGNQHLENGGAYAPGTNIVATTADGTSTTNFVAASASDLAFFQVESAFDFAYSTIDAVFTIERDNRLLLWKISPDIKHTLDKLRPEAVEIRNDYIKARIAYQANPVPANLSQMQTILARIENTAAAVQAAIPANVKAPTKSTK